MNDDGSIILALCLRIGCPTSLPLPLPRPLSQPLFSFKQMARMYIFELGHQDKSEDFDVFRVALVACLLLPVIISNSSAMHAAIF